MIYLLLMNYWQLQSSINKAKCTCVTYGELGISNNRMSQ